MPPDPLRSIGLFWAAVKIRLARVRSPLLSASWDLQLEASTTRGIRNWQHQQLATSRISGIRNWRHPWLEHEDWKLRYIFQQVPLIVAMVWKLSIETKWSRLKKHVPYYHFSTKAYDGRPPKPLKSPLSRWLRRKFPHLYVNYNMLSDKPSQPSPLDVAPTDRLLGELRKQFSLPKQPEALPHTLQRDPSISPISIQFGQGFDWSPDCHGMGIGARVRIF